MNHRTHNVPSERACIECQRRKTRCIFPTGAAVCSYCSKTGKDCTISEKPLRTPLTRRNLDAAEARCRNLEAILRRRSAVPTPSQHQQTPGKAPELKSPEQDRNNNDVGSDPPIPGNEWQEASTLHDDVDTDGMVSLGLPSKNTGYLGSSSGSSLLESLSLYLSPSKRTPLSTSPATAPEAPRNHQDWTGYPNISLNSRVSISAAHEHFIRAYFIAYNSSYPIVHEQTFLQECLHKNNIPSISIWHVIYYMVLAIGEWVSGHSNEHHSLYYEAARSRLKFEILESGSMGVVQAFLLLGNYLQKRDRPNTAYNFIGIAYRVALGLGLHRELPGGGGISPFALQQRQRLFWILYCFDSGFSMTTGRPTMVSDTFIDIRKPRNIDDFAATSSNRSSEEAQYPTTYSAIIAQSRLAVIANKVYNNFLSVRTCCDVEDLVATMEQMIRNWRDSLPPYFFSSDVPQWFLGPRQVVFWKESNLQITLLLAGQRNNIAEQDKQLIRVKCQAAAINAILDISNFCSEHAELVHMGLSWYAVYFLLHATLALGLHGLARDKASNSWTQRADGQASNSLENAISQAHQCLNSLGRNNKAASRTLQILERIQESLEHNEDSDLRQSRVNSDFDGSNPPERHTAGLNPDGTQRYPASQSVIQDNQHLPYPETSPQGPFADCIMNEWVSTADPSFHFLFDNQTADFDNVFEGIEGFPNVLEPDNFEYMTSTTHSIRVPGNNLP